jgi:hypothetical protein
MSNPSSLQLRFPKTILSLKFFSDKAMLLCVRLA